MIREKEGIMYILYIGLYLYDVENEVELVVKSP